MFSVLLFVCYFFVGFFVCVFFCGVLFLCFYVFVCVFVSGFVCVCVCVCMCVCVCVYIGVCVCVCFCVCVCVCVTPARACGNRRARASPTHIWQCRCETKGTYMEVPPVTGGKWAELRERYKRASTPQQQRQNTHIHTHTHTPSRAQRGSDTSLLPVWNFRDCVFAHIGLFPPHSAQFSFLE